MMAEICEALHKIVVYLWAWRSVADDKGFASKFRPVQFSFAGQRMATGKHSKDSLAPQVIGFAFGPTGRSRNKGYIESKLSDCRDVLCRIAINKLDLHTCMVLVISSK